MKTYGPYQAYRNAGNLVFISGQVGIATKTGKSEADIKSQAHQAFKNLQAVVGKDLLQNIVKTTIYLVNMSDFHVVNDIYLKYFDVPRPARTCVGVSELPPIADTPLLIEIDAIVYVEDRE